MQHCAGSRYPASPRVIAVFGARKPGTWLCADEGATDAKNSIFIDI
jgi:hypothetical protein